MTYKNPVGGYKSPKLYRPLKKGRAARTRPDTPPQPRLQCGQGIVSGDERYCPACFKRWPKNEDHP